MQAGSYYHRRTALALALATLPVVSVADSQQAPGFLANVETGLQYEDNIYRTRDNTVADESFELRPTLGWLGLHRGHRFSASYTGGYSRHADEDVLDYENHGIAAEASFDHGLRLQSGLTLGYQNGSEQVNSNDNLQFVGSSRNEFDNKNAEGSVTYGAKTSQGQLEGSLRYDERRYTNNDQSFRDYDRAGATGTFLYRMAPRTQLLFEIDYEENDYREADIFGSNQSSKEWRYLTGVTWEATAKTTGVFKIGYRDRSYDDSRYDDLAGLSLSLKGSWEPDGLTRVGFGASRNNEESAQQGTGGVVRSSFNLSYARSLTPRWRLVSSLEYRDSEYESLLNRSDEELNANVGFEYSLLRWLDIRVAYNYKKRDSNIELAEYDSNIFMVSLATRFD